MFLTRLAVNRPVTTLMACLMVVLLGWNALTRLSIDLMPDITLPVVSVSTVYQGASPEEIETLITRPMEQTLGSVQGVERLASTSLEGSSVIRVQFAWGTNLDSAISDMRARIERVRESLPETIQPPYIQRFDVADFPFVFLGLTSDLDPVRTTEYAERNIVPQLERIPGVASVRVRGGVRREIQVELDRGKLEAMNLDAAEVVAALRRENVNRPAGYLKSGHLKLLVRSHGQFKDVEQIGETIVRSEGGALVRLRDVARIVDGHEEITELSRINGEPGIMVYVYKQAGANMVAASDRVHAEVERINRQIPHGELIVRIDNADYIRNAISNIRETVLYGSTLAVLVLVVFLRSFRSTLVIAVTMPLAVLATFVMVFFKGFTLNIVSFGGLALGIGLLVDNSIVVLESIFRKRDEGLEPKEAAIEGTREVASAIVASTLTTLIVFLPLLFISGMTGILLNQLAWVVSFSLLCSLVASLTLTPMLSAYWIGRSSAAARGLAAESCIDSHSVLSRKRHNWIHRLHGFNRRAFGVFEGIYERVLRSCLRRAGWVGFAVVSLFAVSIGLTPFVGTEFLPKTDEGRFRINARMAAGIQLDTLDRQTRKLEEVVVENVPEADLWYAFIGDGPDEADDWNESRLIVSLPGRDERTRDIEEVTKLVSEKIGAVPGMTLNVRASNEMMMFRMISRRAGSDGDIEVEVRGYDLHTGEDLANAVADLMKEIPGLVNVEVQIEERRPELNTYVDRTKAGLMGIDMDGVTQTLETSVRGTEATVYREQGDEFNIRVWLREADRERLADLQQVGLSNPVGQIVTLGNLVRFDRADVPISIDRRDQQRFIGVTADVVDRDLGSAVGDLQARLDRLPLPEDFSLNIAGDWEEQQSSFFALRRGFVLAVILMYMVMASQFESLRDPLLILVTIPLGAIGVIAVLTATGTTLNVQSFIGVVILAGIVVNNAIVLIDYMNQLKRSGAEHDLDELIVHAAGRRFRPVLMTTLTTVLAMLPIALGWGEGGELQAPMARVVIGGLVSGTLITLLAIPLLYRFASGAEFERGR